MKQTSAIFFSPSLYEYKKEVSLKVLCCHNDTWFHRNSTFLKPWANQCIFPKEVFILSYVNVLCIYCRLCLQVRLAKGSEVTWHTSVLYLYIVLLIYVNETILIWKSAFFFFFLKMHVNHFMALDDSPGAILWVLRRFLSLADCQ